MTKMTVKEQRELLQLQARLARLKISTEHLRAKKQAEQSGNITNMLSLSNFSLPDNVLLKVLALPLSWKNRALLGTGWFLFQRFLKK
ncbi:hypothetical protein [Neisseria weaveri]|uniref:hypothetical protein n=1 Tax=Neisseria weaveri TaxID=28091 RepID=UPI001F3E76A5|nr:hypothetical protein [Neisseria weaveri]